MTDIFHREQKGVALGALAALGVSAASLAIAWTWGDRLMEPAPALSDRLTLALQADLLVVGWLAAAIAAVAQVRFSSPTDIAGAGLTTASPRLARRAAVLQNTLEQTVLAVVAHLTLATVLRPDEGAVLLALAALFCLGRAFFWVGYSAGASRRAFGFGLTFYPTAFALLLSGGLVLLRS